MQPAPSISLRVFFERCFVPDRLAGQPPHRAQICREAITWLERTLGREAKLPDLTADKITRLERRVTRDCSRKRASRLVFQLRAVVVYASRLGLAAAEACIVTGGEPVRLTKPPKFLNDAPGGDSLSAALETLRPKLQRSERRNSVNTWAAAVHQFNVFLGRYAVPTDVSAQQLANFREHLLAAGRAESLCYKYAARLRAVARVLEPHAFPDRRYKLSPLPTATPGTLREFFEASYRTERLVGCSRRHLDDCRYTLRLLFDFQGSSPARTAKRMSGRTLRSPTAASIRRAAIAPASTRRERPLKRGSLGEHFPQPRDQLAPDFGLDGLPPRYAMDLAARNQNNRPSGAVGDRSVDHRRRISGGDNRNPL